MQVNDHKVNLNEWIKEAYDDMSAVRYSLVMMPDEEMPPWKYRAAKQRQEAIVEQIKQLAELLDVDLEEGA